MLGTETLLLTSKFLNYDPVANTSSTDFGKFSSCRVVFLADAGTTAVVHNLCKELLAACVRGPSCLLMGKLPIGMHFSPEDIPGWSDLPDQLQIEGADSMKAASKHVMLDIVHLEAQQIDLHNKRRIQRIRNTQEIAQVFKDNPWQKDKEGHIRVDLPVYARIYDLYSVLLTADYQLHSQIETIENEIDEKPLEAWEEQDSCQRMHHLCDRIVKLSDKFPKIFVLLPEELIAAGAGFYQQLRERSLETILLMPNKAYYSQILEELEGNSKSSFKSFTIETEWQKIARAFNKEKGIYQPAREMESFEIRVIKQCWADFPKEFFEASSKRPFPVLDSSTGHTAQGKQEKNAKQRTAEKNSESASPASPVNDQPHGETRDGCTDVGYPANKPIGGSGGILRA